METSTSGLTGDQRANCYNGRAAAGGNCYNGRTAGGYCYNGRAAGGISYNWRAAGEVIESICEDRITYKEATEIKIKNLYIFYHTMPFALRKSLSCLDNKICSCLFQHHQHSKLCKLIKI